MLNKSQILNAMSLDMSGVHAAMVAGGYTDHDYISTEFAGLGESTSEFVYTITYRGASGVVETGLVWIKYNKDKVLEGEY